MTIFFIYQGEVRHWLAGATIDVDKGLTSLRRRLSFAFEMDRKLPESGVSTPVPFPSKTKTKKTHK
jgi:hypothetical protein